MKDDARDPFLATVTQIDSFKLIASRCQQNVMTQSVTCPSECPKIVIIVDQMNMSVTGPIFETTAVPVQNKQRKRNKAIGGRYKYRYSRLLLVAYR
jgi:hypothetical protein